MCMIHASVSVASNSVHSSTAADQGYHSFGELARFVYCMLQKSKKAWSMPLVEQWERNVIRNYSWFLAIYERDFFFSTRVMVALDKVSPWCLSLSRWFCELCSVDRCFKISQRTGYELLPPSSFGSWGWRRSFTAVQQRRTRVGPEGAKLNCAGLSTSSLCWNSSSWSGRPRRVALT